MASPQIMTGGAENKAAFEPLAQNSFDGIALARELLRAIPSGALATLAAGSGFPFASLTSLATASDGAPLLLLSGLAHHTRNLKADSRASLLLSQGGKGDPLAHPRLTLVGRLAPIAQGLARDLARARYLRRHPKAELYADFADFGFWRFEINAAHLNGGFARAADYPGADMLTDVSGAEKLLEAEAALLDELNAAEGRGPSPLAELFGAPAKTRLWRASGLDPDGLDLTAPGETARIAFATPARDPAQWRAALRTAAKDAPKTGADAPAP